MTAQQPPQRSAWSSGHRFDDQRCWEARLRLGFQEDGGVTRLRDVDHYGPLRVQRPFYPEGSHGPCHVYLLHPPGGLVSGDRLHVDVRVEPGASALLTTPAANKLYRADSHGVAWKQHTRLSIADAALVEWLPQETIAFDGSRGIQETEVVLEKSARCLGWEVLALGRPASQMPFASGHLEQRFRLTLDGRPLWLERQPLDPLHRRFHGRWGQGGHQVQATLWAAGLADPLAAIEEIRRQLDERASPDWAVTHRHGVLLLRYLGNSRAQAWELCEAAWAVLRPLFNGREVCPPRIWRT